MKRLLVSMSLVLILFAAAPLYAVEGCKQCVPVEVFSTICYVYDWWEDSHTPYTCGSPPQIDPTFESLGSTVVVTQNGEKCQTVTATYFPSAWMTSSHSSSFTDWWNMILNSPPGSGATGPAPSYSTTMSGSTFCASPYQINSMTTSNGVPYTLKTWFCAPSGQFCQSSVYVYGTDGE